VDNISIDGRAVCVHVRHLVRRHHERHCCMSCGRAYHKPYLLRLHMYNRHKVKDPSLKVQWPYHSTCLFMHITSQLWICLIA